MRLEHTAVGPASHFGALSKLMDTVKDESLLPARFFLCWVWW